jgi:hypothetical protein
MKVDGIGLTEGPQALVGIAGRLGSWRGTADVSDCHHVCSYRLAHRSQEIIDPLEAVARIFCRGSRHRLCETGGEPGPHLVKRWKGQPSWRNNTRHELKGENPEAEDVGESGVLFAPQLLGRHKGHR